MDSKSIRTAILSSINDCVNVVEYGHGYLVTMPETYYDNDRVTLFVEPYEQGFRVTDRGTTALRLHAADLNLENDRIQSGWSRSIAATELFNPAGDDLEIADWGDEEVVADLLFKVADASLRVDQLRWLVTERRPQRFADVVTTRLVDAVQSPEEVLPLAPLELRSGRSRRVTAAVGSADDAKVFVQAVGGGRTSESQELAIERCYHLFGSAKGIPFSRRIAFAAGAEKDWPRYVISELGEVCEIVFDAQQTTSSLRSFLRERLPQPAI